MKMFYHNALLAEGFDENSEMYKEIEKLFNRESKRFQRDRKEREECGITFNYFSEFEKDGVPYDCFPSDENVEEKILHGIELEALRECVYELPKDDRDFLIKIFKDEIPLRVLAADMGVNHQNLMYRRDKLLKLLREKMAKKKF